MPKKATAKRKAAPRKARATADSRRRSGALAEPYGVSWYVGCPHSGKTTLASVHARLYSKQFRLRIVVLDTEETDDFSGLVHCRPRDLPRVVWTDGQAAAVKPRDLADVELVARAVRGGKNAVLLVDEASLWLSNRRCSEELLRVLRTTQHCRSRVLLTTQHFSGDIPQAALACAPDLFLFRTTSPRAIETLSKHFDVNAGQVRNLPRYDYLHQRTTFDAGP